ncbi:MAG: 30S ribosomal protein S17e [Nanoarchaeota archaeon]|nr:30S ribosomal protein S17e [Nanoarchaeota archaeon]
MGRIKSTAIKRTSRTLISENPDLCEDFEKNKEVLKIYNLPDKGTRNKIAGYIARLKKVEKLENPIK